MLIGPRSVSTFLTASRARRARRPRFARLSFLAATDALTHSAAAVHRRQALGKVSHAGRLLPLLGPSGHGGVGAAQAQGRPSRPAGRRFESSQACFTKAGNRPDNRSRAYRKDGSWRKWPPGLCHSLWLRGCRRRFFRLLSCLPGWSSFSC
jgi:hypothetical protein